MFCADGKPACNGQRQPPAPREDVLGTQIDAAGHQNACAIMASKITWMLANISQPLQAVSIGGVRGVFAKMFSDVPMVMNSWKST